LRLAPEDSRARRALGEILLDFGAASPGDLAHAEAELRAAVRLNPEDRVARFALGEVLALRGSSEGEAMLDSLRSDGGTAPLENAPAAGESLRVEGEPRAEAGESLRALELAFHGSSDHSIAGIELAARYRDAGRIREAASILETLAIDDPKLQLPEIPPPDAMLAPLDLSSAPPERAQNLELARRLRERFVREPDNVDLVLHLARVLDDAGRSDDAAHLRARGFEIEASR
jgi:thioredoxin-like negative regulator of GroEL